MLDLLTTKFIYLFIWKGKIIKNKINYEKMIKENVFDYSQEIVNCMPSSC